VNVLLPYSSKEYSNLLKIMSHFKEIPEDLSENCSLLDGKGELTAALKGSQEIMALLHMRKESSLEQGNSR